jgi:hypothetical protein
MAEKSWQYRIWENGGMWHWEVVSPEGPLASGTAAPSAEARAAAFNHWIRRDRTGEQTSGAKSH